MTGWWVWLSGSVPDLSDLQRYGWSELDLRFMVGQLADQLLGAGHGIVHGAHPTFSPIIEQVASGFPGASPRVRIVVTRWHFPSPETADHFVKRHAYAKVTFTPPLATREQSLTAMREELARCCDAVVCLGGRLHESKDRRPGVEQEVELAAQHRRPIYLLGSFGGFTQQHYQTRFRDRTDELHNELDRDDNTRLAETPDPSLALTILMKGLARARAARGP